MAVNRRGTRTRQTKAHKDSAHSIKPRLRRFLRNFEEQKEDQSITYISGVIFTGWWIGPPFDLPSIIFSMVTSVQKIQLQRVQIYISSIKIYISMDIQSQNLVGSPVPWSQSTKIRNFILEIWKRKIWKQFLELPKFYKTRKLNWESNFQLFSVKNMSEQISTKRGHTPQRKPFAFGVSKTDVHYLFLWDLWRQLMRCNCVNMYCKDQFSKCGWKSACWEPRIGPPLSLPTIGNRRSHSGQNYFFTWFICLSLLSYSPTERRCDGRPICPKPASSAATRLAPNEVVSEDFGSPPSDQRSRYASNSWWTMPRMKDRATVLWHTQLQHTYECITGEEDWCCVYFKLVISRITGQRVRWGGKRSSGQYVWYDWLQGDTRIRTTHAHTQTSHFSPHAPHLLCLSFSKYPLIHDSSASFCVSRGTYTNIRIHHMYVHVWYSI